MERPQQLIITDQQRIEALRAGLPEPKLTDYQNSFLMQIVEHNEKVEDQRFIVIPVTDRQIKLTEYVWSPSMWPKYNPPTTAEPAAEP